MSDETGEALSRWRLSAEGAPLQLLLQTLNSRYGLQGICKARSVTGPELTSVDCLSGRNLCVGEQHAAICLIRPKDMFWRNFELLAIYECQGQFFENFIQGSKKEFRKGLPKPEKSYSLGAQNLKDPSDPDSFVLNRISHNEAAMSHLMAFAVSLDLDAVGESNRTFLNRFDLVLAKLNRN